jgi:hypothetical protein
MSKQVTSITFFRFTTPRSMIWAFFMMQFARAPLRKVKGLERFFLMGTGKKGFSPNPDWSTYALLQIWNSQEEADYYFSSHPLYSSYVRNSEEILRVMMRNIKAHGAWNGINPFQKSSQLDPENPYIAAITRATIKTRFQLKFWRAVPYAQRFLDTTTALKFTKGIGEVPFRNMATFSIWESEEDLRQFAYTDKHHKKAIAQTKSLNWYSEELFSRFQPYQIYGTYLGQSIELS